MAHSRFGVISFASGSVTRSGSARLQATAQNNVANAGSSSTQRRDRAYRIRNVTAMIASAMTLLSTRRSFDGRASSRIGTKPSGTMINAGQLDSNMKSGLYGYHS